MKLFNLKATCAFCGEPAGFNRRKIVKSNCWICSSCMKKAGGITAVDCFLDTKENIEGKIKNNISDNIHIETKPKNDKKQIINLKTILIFFNLASLEQPLMMKQLKKADKKS